MGMSKRQKLAAALPRPPTVQILPDRNVFWNDKPKAAAKVRALRALGFRLIGSHRISNLDSVRLVALGHPDEGFAAVVFEDDDVGPWVELIALYRPGGSLTVTDLDHPEVSSSSHPRIGMEGATPEKLLETLRLHLSPHEALRTFGPRSFRGLFEDLYARQRQALQDTGEVDVAAIARQVKKGGRVWRVALVGCVTMIVVAVVAGWFAYNLVSSMLFDVDAEVTAEARAFGAETDRRGCLDEALRRTGEDEVLVAVANMAFLNACLSAAAPSAPPLCEGVPSSFDFNATSDWGVVLCAEYGRDLDPACATLVGTIPGFCEFSGTATPTGELPGL